MDIQKIISQMTLEGKTALLNGKDFWHLKGVERLGVPSVMVTDGPHGLRKQQAGADHLGLNASVPATAFPTAAATACSFDRELLYQMGQALGELCQEEDVSVILGPGANIKRSPLCGRNFEYFSEDPYLTGEMAAAHIRGVQSRNVGTSLKHFAMNNQEHRRLSVSVEADERTMREIYLTGFEKAVRQAKPWTVMCSYNKIGGVYSSENRWLLRDLLRGEWGLDGYTMTDWGACADHVKGVLAGMDLSMPSLGDAADAELAQAVRDGRVPESVVDEAVKEILTIIDRYVTNHKKDPDFSLGVQHHLARKIARESAVLLKNDGALPLTANAGQKILVCGPRAGDMMSLVGGWSSEQEGLTIAAAVAQYAGEKDDVTYIADDVAAIADAAKDADVVIVSVGEPSYQHDPPWSYDTLEITASQQEILEAVKASTSGQIITVVTGGRPYILTWCDENTNAVLEAYYPGQQGGIAIAETLFGLNNPTGKTPMQFPRDMDSVNDQAGDVSFDLENPLYDYGWGLSYGQ